MLNNYTIVFLLALVAFIESMPKIDTDSTEEEEAIHINTNTIVSREVYDKIHGAIHHIKPAGVTYQQHIKDNECFVEYDGQLLAENSLVKIRKKLFRVENCLLERVYHVCGPNLLLMLSVVCRVIEQHQIPSYESINFKRETSLLPIDHFDSTAYKKKRIITESCCENLCNVAELTRYCHR
jgi:hypothetical protein